MQVAEYNRDEDDIRQRILRCWDSQVMFLSKLHLPVPSGGYAEIGAARGPVCPESHAAGDKDAAKNKGAHLCLLFLGRLWSFLPG